MIGRKRTKENGNDERKKIRLEMHDEDERTMRNQTVCFPLLSFIIQ